MPSKICHDLSVTVSITALGAKGDGIGKEDGGDIFVPFALPGETVRVGFVGSEAHLDEIITSSPERCAPFCHLFTQCGGCAVQHMSESLNQRWKLATLKHFLERETIPAPNPVFIDATGQGRRRVTLHVREYEGRFRAGFMASRTHALVPVECCPVLVPALQEKAPFVAGQFGSICGQPLDVLVTATESGLDVDVRGLKPLGEVKKHQLVQCAASLDLARLSLHSIPLITLRQPVILMGGIPVAVPAGTFLQATEAGETVMADHVLAGCQEQPRKASHIADTFAGCGPFSLRLAASPTLRARIHAIEYEKDAIDSLAQAARSHKGLKPVTCEQRDLFRRPLLVQELNQFDTVILNPPRAGAQSQVRMLAASKVSQVLSLSCNPATFARDAAILVKGGYRLETLILIDQFRASPHFEVFGRFQRGF
jgi:23S rRNA (uracil1939-C5)-methyltransferase